MLATFCTIIVGDWETLKMVRNIGSKLSQRINREEKYEGRRSCWSFGRSVHVRLLRNLLVAK